MRALVLESFGRMSVQQVAEPELGASDVAIRVAAVGICGSDVHGDTGENGRRVPGQIMGHEAAGRIVAIGSDAGRNDLTVGELATFIPVVLPPADVILWEHREQHHPDRYVIGVRPDVSAAFADVLVVPARNVVPLAASTPAEHGALIEPLAVAVHAVRRSPVAPGDAVLVLGGGPIGQSVAVALRMAGVSGVIVSEPVAARRELLERLGTVTVDPSVDDLAAVMTHQWGRPADVAIDAVGITATLRTALANTRFGATVVLVGMGAPELDVDAYRVSTEERSVVGSFTYTYEDFRDGARFIESAPDIADDLISEQVDPDAADAAFARLAAGEGPAGKIIVRF